MFTEGICLSSFSYGLKHVDWEQGYTQILSTPHLQHMFTSTAQSPPRWYMTHPNTIQSRILCLVSRLHEKNVPNDLLKPTNNMSSSFPSLDCSYLTNREMGPVWHYLFLVNMYQPLVIIISAFCFITNIFNSLAFNFARDCWQASSSVVLLPTFFSL